MHVVYIQKQPQDASVAQLAQTSQWKLTGLVRINRNWIVDVVGQWQTLEGASRGEIDPFSQCKNVGFIVILTLSTNLHLTWLLWSAVYKIYKQHLYWKFNCTIISHMQCEFQGVILTWRLVMTFIQVTCMLHAIISILLFLWVGVEPIFHRTATAEK